MRITAIDCHLLVQPDDLDGYARLADPLIPRLAVVKPHCDYIDSLPPER